MGAWGPGNFENDDALDWIGDLTGTKDGWAMIRAVLAEAAKADLPDVRQCCFALAAAECVAISRGKPPEKPSSAAATWCAQNRKGPSEELRVLALKAVLRVRADSELKDLWDEGEETDWDDVVGDLERRLST